MSLCLQNAPELAPFLDWRQGGAELEDRQKRFEEWLFLNASSVLLSEKTGELLALNLAEMALDANEVEEGLERLAGMWGFDFALLYESNGLLKFIVFQRERLAAILDEAPFCVMVGQLHYAPEVSPEGFLAEVRRRWERRGEVPHEIGLALGYPLDDVFGYMGLLPLSCKGVCGWQVYGCMEESERRSCAFRDARCRALAFLAMTAPPRASA